MVARQWIPEVIRAVRVFWFTGLLRLKAASSEVMIKHSGCEFIADDGFYRRPADVEFASPMMRGPVDRPGSDLGLKDRRHRLSLMLQAALDPFKLRCVQRRAYAPW